MTNEERARRRKEIADAMLAPGADIESVANKFGVSLKRVYVCCREFEVPLPLRTHAKRRKRFLNWFAILNDLLAGMTMEACGIKHKVSKQRIGQLAKLAREAGWTELAAI